MQRTAPHPEERTQCASRRIGLIKPALARALAGRAMRLNFAIVWVFSSGVAGSPCETREGPASGALMNHSAFVVSALFLGIASAHAAGLRDLCAANAREAGLQGGALNRFERRCVASPLAAIVFADPLCRKAAQETAISSAASTRLENLSRAQRRAGEDCAIEQTMLGVNDAMLALIDRSPSHCGHTSAGVELMRASQNTMRRIGC
jgi:hypothetical protein